VPPDNHRRHNWARAGWLVALAALALAALDRGKTIPLFCAAFAALFVLALLLAYCSRTAKALIYNVAFVFFALAAAELYFNYQRIDDGLAYEYLGPNSALGYAAQPGTFRAIKTTAFGRRTVFDATYTIDSNHFRVGRTIGNGPAVFFFGDSFAFGEGLNDDETLPSAFAAISGMPAFNFATGGYGPHQMLRMLELDLPGVAAAPPPQVVVYSALPDHIDRAAGRATWDQDGPLYQVRDGHAVFAGSFQENGICNSFPPWEPLLKDSRIYRAIYPPAFFPAPRQPDALAGDRARYLAIVNATRALVEQRYHARMVVILWEDPSRGETLAWIASRLSESGFAVMRPVSHLGAPDADQWYLRDGHPTARLQRAVARQLLNFLKQGQPDL
jgi:hypothetical protein